MNWIKNRNFWYKLFLVIGLIGFLDLVLFLLIREAGFIEGEIGSFIALPLLYLFSALFGTSIASVAVFLLSQFWWLWLLIAWVIKRESPKTTGDVIKTNEQRTLTSKNFKITLAVILIPFGILLLIGIIANL